MDVGVPYGSDYSAIVPALRTARHCPAAAYVIMRDMKLHDVLNLEPEAAVHVDNKGVRCNGTMFIVAVGDVGEVNDNNRSLSHLYECPACKRYDLEVHNGKIADLARRSF